MDCKCMGVYIDDEDARDRIFSGALLLGLDAAILAKYVAYAGDPAVVDAYTDAIMSMAIDEYEVEEPAARWLPDPSVD